MKYLMAMFLAVTAQQATSAETLVGTATLKFQQPSKYQPGSCAEQTLAKATGDLLDEICIDMSSWKIYEVSRFRDLKGNEPGIKSVVAVSHLDLSGEWLLVVERLSEAEAAKFGAQYRIVNRGPVRPTACLNTPIEKYTGNPAPSPASVPREGYYCYDVVGLERTEQQRIPPLPTEVGKVTYYDQNRDGNVDLEIHDLGCCDRNWALVDTDFDGRYDGRIIWSYSVHKVAIDTPVTKGMRVSGEGPPEWATELR